MKTLFIIPIVISMPVYGSVPCIDDNNFSSAVIKQGSGKFSIDTQQNEKLRTVIVHYYRPSKFNQNRPILLVIPGAGRHGDRCSDAFIKKAEQYGVLILSPSFSETDFPGPLNYNLARMIDDGSIQRDTGKFSLRSDRRDWIFEDIENIFNFAIRETKSKRRSYDLFGHSAGGQFVHRQVLFAKDTKIDRAIAASSGWYTVATPDQDFPYGLKHAPFSKDQLKRSFKRRLIVMIGEIDKAAETRGHLLQNAQTRKQGDGRLSRGNYFFRMSQNYAINSNYKFRWTKQIVADVGHSYKKTAHAAADRLYSEAREVR